MHQGHSGTDVCEHFFVMIHNQYTNPTLQHCNEATSKFGSLPKSNLFTNKHDRQNAAGAQVSHDEYLAPLPKN